MNELSKEELLGFVLLSECLSRKTDLNESEKVLVSNLILTCINDRTFSKRLNQTLPQILSSCEDQDAISAAADMLIRIAFRTRMVSEEVEIFIENALVSYKRFRHASERKS